MSQAAALVPRVSDALTLAAGDPLIVLFGPGASGKFLRFNGSEREFAEWFARWPHAPTAVDNICVLVFTERSLARTDEFIRSLGYVNVLADCLERQTARPAGRRAGEMRNLVQELETNWARRVRADITEPVTPDDLPSSYLGFA